MNSYANYIKTIIEQEPENKLLEARTLYNQSFSTIPEMTYYKTLERMCKKGSLVHLTKGLFEYPLSTGNCQNKKMTVSIFLVFMYKNNFINWIHLLIMGN